MNEWLSLYLHVYTTHTTSCLMAVYNSIEWDRTPACEGTSGCRYQSIFYLMHPPNPCMKCEMKLDIDPGTSSPTLSDKCVGSLTSPANHKTLKIQETGPTIYSPYPRRLQCLTLYRYNYKGSTFSSVILRPRVLVRSEARTLDLPHSSTNWANQVAGRVYIEESRR